jgi:serine/threonine-protein kinase HipA
MRLGLICTYDPSAERFNLSLHAPLSRAMNGDTAGALSFGQPGRASPAQWRTVGNPEALERMIEDLPNKAFLAGDEGLSMSLAGVQSKVAVAVDCEGRICIPMNGSPSTHILKPDSPRLPGGVQNEAFCLTLAKRMRIPAPEVTTGRAGMRTYLLVKRYDRIDAGDRCRRLHQEDYCQALGKPPSAKYEANQTGICGPTLKDMFDVTRRYMSPTEIVRLLDMVIVNVLACNSDAHAKNYSIMIRANNASLAPVYDMMCGEVWENVTKNLAQKIAGMNRCDHLNRTQWQQFARECGLNAKQVVDRIVAFAKSAIAEAKVVASEIAAMPAGGHPILQQAQRAVERRAQRLLLQLQELDNERTVKAIDEAAGQEKGSRSWR